DWPRYSRSSRAGQGNKHFGTEAAPSVAGARDHFILRRGKSLLAAQAFGGAGARFRGLVPPPPGPAKAVRVQPKRLADALAGDLDIPGRAAQVDPVTGLAPGAGDLKGQCRCQLRAGWLLIAVGPDIAGHKAH